MRKLLIAGNWKMNMDVQSGGALASSIRTAVEAEKPVVDVSIAVCPPFPLLEIIRVVLSGSPIALGAQNVHYEDDGAYTGEVSADMLSTAGCAYVIAGHSERRQYFLESDDVINKKARKVLQKGLSPVVCVGETLAQRENGSTRNVISMQIEGVLSDFSVNDLQNTIIAYEPVWAIGTGKTATPEQAQEVHSFIRTLVGEKFGTDAAESLTILYGGSMKPDNAFILLSQKDVDGGLIGGASLKTDAFVSIIREANKVRK